MYFTVNHKAVETNRTGLLVGNAAKTTITTNNGYTKHAVNMHLYIFLIIIIFERNLMTVKG